MTNDIYEASGITLTLDDTLTIEKTAREQLEGYRDIRIGVATPHIRLGDVAHNERAILDLISQANQAGADALLFSDMALTGRSAGDLFFQRTLQDACLESLARITKATAHARLLVLLSLPLRLEQHLYKATAILYDGEIVGMTLASYLSREERRWFSDPLCSDIGEHDSFSCELITQAGNGKAGSGVSTFHLPPDECPTILRHTIDRPPLPVNLDSDTADVMTYDFSLCEMTTQNLLSFTFKFVNLCTVIPCLAVRPSLLSGEFSKCDELRLFNFDSSHAVDALSHGSIPVAAIADARPEWAGDYRQLKSDLIRRSLRDHSIILYAGAGKGESSSGGIYAGRRLIVSDGRVLGEGEPFTTGLTMTEIPAKDLFAVRNNAKTSWDILKLNPDSDAKQGNPDRHPFLLRHELEGVSLFTETLAIQGNGLADRLATVGARPILGLSGGLDSAVALLASLEAVRLLNRPYSDVLAVSMPGPGTSQASRRLARSLGEAMGVDFREIAIDQAVTLHLEAIGHDGVAHDVTYENAQARERTQILMDLANLEGGIVVGTGDLSELALGWCTYNGDQMSMYSVNTSLAKTVIREMTRVAADLLDKGTSPFVIDRDRAATAASALREILQRPVSPELLPPGRDDTLLQLTESAIGPYGLIDFFLWHLVFGRKKPSVVYELARAAFADEYSGHEIQTWFKTFIRRFFHNQFKRTASPEGVAVFPRRLLPENAWQMPGDARPDLWLAELEVHIAGRQESSL